MYQNAFNCEAFNLPHITNIKDVERFADYLVNGLSVNFHPDDPFENYVSYEDGSPIFSDKDIETGNRLMEECFDVCESNGTDVYEIMGIPLFERLGLG